MQIKSYNEKKVADYLKEKPEKVALFFWHGLGDLLMFLKPFQLLKESFPDTKIDIVLQDGVGQHQICPYAILVSGEDKLNNLNYDYIFHIHFPMSEYDKDPKPKPEKCCIEELGITPISGHKRLDSVDSRIVGVSFQATALPGLASVEEKIAKKMWDEIIASQLVPVEVTMQHVYHNPKNKKFDFINCTLRGAKPRLDSMMSVICRCFAFIGVSSGPVHLALSMLPPSRVAYIEKDFKLITITREKLKVFNINNYKEGEVKEWLNTLL